MTHEGLAEELVKLAEHLVGGYGMLFVVVSINNHRKQRKTGSIKTDDPRFRVIKYKRLS